MSAELEEVGNANTEKTEQLESEGGQQSGKGDDATAGGTNLPAGKDAPSETDLLAAFNELTDGIDGDGEDGTNANNLGGSGSGDLALDLERELEMELANMM